MSGLDDTFKTQAARLQQGFTEAASIRSKLIASVSIRMFGEDIGHSEITVNDLEKLAEAFTTPEMKLEFLQGVSWSMEEDNSNAEVRPVLDAMLGNISGASEFHHA